MTTAPQQKNEFFKIKGVAALGVAYLPNLNCMHCARTASLDA